MSFLFKVKKNMPVFVIGLVIICVLAVLSDYKVTIDSKHGFRFEPVGNIQ